MRAERGEAGAAPWYLVQLRPNGLAQAERGLRRQGFELFSPRVMTAIRRKGRLASGSAALFPGYLFAAFDPDRPAWRAIGSTRGVARLVGTTTAGPSPVPADLVAGLMARCDAAGVLRPPEDLEAGTRVRVVAGPFAGLVSEVEGIAPDRRVHLLLDCLGRASRVTLPADQLRRARER